MMQYINPVTNRAKGNKQHMEVRQTVWKQWKCCLPRQAAENGRVKVQRRHNLRANLNIDGDVEIRYVRVCDQWTLKIRGSHICVAGMWECVCGQVFPHHSKGRSSLFYGVRQSFWIIKVKRGRHHDPSKLRKLSAQHTDQQLIRLEFSVNITL